MYSLFLLVDFCFSLYGWLIERIDLAKMTDFFFLFSFLGTCMQGSWRFLEIFSFDKFVMGLCSNPCFYFVGKD